VSDQPKKPGCNRREFLKKTLEASAALTLTPALVPLLQAQTPFAASPPDLAVVTGNIAAAVRASIDLLGGMARFVKRGDQVVLKPNMSFATLPPQGSTTHPDVVATVAALCLEAGAKHVLVVDHTLREPSLCRERTGVEAACRSLEAVFLLTPAEEKLYQEFPIPGGRALRDTKAIRGVMEADVLINLPVAKSHGTTTVSLGMKNLMGLIWDRRILHSFKDINEGITDLCSLFKPSLTLVDATRPLVDGGPGGPGNVVALDTIVAGVDPVAVDAFTVTLTPWYGKQLTPFQIKHIVAASQRGLGEINLANLKIQRQKA
jgi:uncharacterized protein (DUF362 family)